MEVRKAVIPAAGRGTRMAPISEVVPKELLPLGTRPMIQFAVDEAREAQIEQIAVVINGEKALIREYFEKLKKDRAYRNVEFSYFYQERARGLADAIDQCREFVEGEPFAVLLPDNVIFSPDYRFSMMVELYREEGRDVVGIIELGPEQSGLYGDTGRIDYDWLRPGVLEIRKLYNKGKGTIHVPSGAKAYRTCGRYVCHEDVFKFMDLIRPQVSGEFDEVPVYQEIIRRRGAVGHLIPGLLFDTGNPNGYLAANAHLSKR